MADKIVPLAFPQLPPETIEQKIQRTFTPRQPELTAASPAFARACAVTEPDNTLSHALYSAGSYIKRFSDNPAVAAESPYLEAINQAGSLNEKVGVTLKRAAGLAGNGLGSVGSVLNVVTGFGDAAVAYTDAVDNCGRPNFDFGYSVTKSVLKTGLSSVLGASVAASATTVATGALGSLVAGSGLVAAAPVIAGFAVGAAAAYGTGYLVGEFCDFAKPYVGSVFGEGKD